MADLDALVESARLSLHAPTAAAVEQLDATIETVALTYSAHPPARLFVAVHEIRTAVASALEPHPPEPVATRMRSAAGWLSALLGNLSYHLDARPAAAAHWGTAVSLGQVVDDHRLISWSRGAQAMLARSNGDPVTALHHAEDGFAHATTSNQKAQLLGWALLPAAADLGRTDDANTALHQALDYMDKSGDTFGRFGFDRAELLLHSAEAHLALTNGNEAIQHGDDSAALCTVGGPGWTAATLTAARGHATSGDHNTSVQLAHHVLDTAPPDRLRATSRTRLAKLSAAVTDNDLTERLYQLPPLTEN